MDRSRNASPKVFISYSRRDVAFADRLFALLEERGFEPFLDRQDIAPGEAWQPRLSDLIAAADAVALVVSPSSIRSPVVAWEVNEAERLGKRILPIIWRDVPQEEVPERIRRLNYIFLARDETFASEFERLAQAILVDIVWVREGARLLELARRWEALARPDASLLAGDDIRRAEDWLMRAPLTVPSPPDLTRSFIARSREAHDAAMTDKAHALGRSAAEANDAGDHALAALLAIEALTLESDGNAPAAVASEAEQALSAAYQGCRELRVVFGRGNAQGSAGDLQNASDSGVVCAVFAPDGKTGVSYAPCSPGAALWETENGRPVAEIGEGESGVEDLAFSPQGKRLLTVEGFTARLWDAATGRLVVLLNPDSWPPVRRAAFSPDGRRIAAACFSSLRVFDAETGREELATDPGSDPVANVVFSPGGDEIWTRLTREDFHTGVRETPAVVAWGAGDGRERLRFAGDAADNDKLPVFTEKGPRILARSDGGRCSLWDPATGTRLAILAETAHPYDLARLAVSRNGSSCALSDGTGPVRVWNLVSGRRILDLAGADRSPSALCFDECGLRLAAASRDGAAQIWDVNPPGFFERRGRAPALVLKDHAGPVTSVCFSHDGHKILTACADGKARLWRAATGELAAVFAGSGAPLSGAFFSPDSTRILTLSSDGAVRLWDAEDPDAVSILQGRGEKFRTADFNAACAAAVTTSLAGAMRLWDAGTGRLAGERVVANARFPLSGRQCDLTAGESRMLLFSETLRKADRNGGPPVARGAALSPEGSFVLSIHDDFTCGLWRRSALSPVRLLGDHFAPVQCFAFATNAALFATGSLDRTVCVYRLDTGDLLARLAHAAPIASLKFSADGGRLLAGLDDNSSILWDVKSQGMIGPYRAQEDGLLAIRLAEDGSCLAAIHPPGSAEPVRFVLLSAGGGKRTSAVADEGIPPSSLAISRDLRRAALADGSGAVRLADTATGRVLARLAGSDLSPRVFFCGDASVLAISGWRSLVFHDAGGAEILRLALRRGGVNHVGMNAAGTHVMLSFDDGRHELRSFPEGRNIAVFPRPALGEGARAAAVFAEADGWAISAAGGACQLWRYFPTTTALVEAMGAQLSRSLTPDERRRFLLNPGSPSHSQEQGACPR